MIRLSVGAGISTGIRREDFLFLTLISAIALAPGIVAESPSLSTQPPTYLRQRKNIRSLNPTEIQGLRDAVAAMKALPASDPRSWEAQAAIHNNFCPHGHSDFLPWHRKYLYYFEKILIHFSGGQLDAMPYWDYTVPAEAMLPPEFVSPTYGSGTPNPLYHSNRSATYASGVTAIPNGFVNPSGANSQLSFSGFSSSLEGTPHDNVHIQLGGTMGTYWSPRDPIFWFHHCNIDRLWENWLSLGGGRANPTNATWLNANYLNTEFVDESSVTHQPKNSDVLNTIAQLDYTYGPVRRPFPFRDYYLWRRLWWWEILRPIPFDWAIGPFVSEAIRMPREELALLKRIEQVDLRATSLVLEFNPVKGMSSAGTFDLIARGGRGTKPARIKTFSLFVIQHNEGHSGHGMTPDKRKIQMVLNEQETARFLPILRSGQMSFTVQLAKDSANNVRLAENPKMVIELSAMGLMQSVRTRRPIR